MTINHLSDCLYVSIAGITMMVIIVITLVVGMIGSLMGTVPPAC